uniref:Uncharacterized protein n=1 Tax=Triticum urartu TaxID=4572 RepID=A0A8R7K1A5_TRIUA
DGQWPESHFVVAASASPKGTAGAQILPETNAILSFPNKNLTTPADCEPAALSLSLCPPPPRALASLQHPSRRRRRPLAGTLNGRRHRRRRWRALRLPHGGGGLPRLPRPPRRHDQGPHPRSGQVLPALRPRVEEFEKKNGAGNF